MTEFWKSNARKFCEFCRVWFADNKSSIDFHERGKKHQENVKRKLGELRKKGLKQHEEQQHTKSYLQQMEEDALKAFKKDAQKDSSLVSQYNQAAVEYKVRQYQEQQEQEPKPPKQQEGTWYEGKNEDGYSYYWNDVTGVSQWEQPATFVPLQEAAESSSEEETSEENKKEKSEKTDDADSGAEEEDDDKKDGDDDKDDEDDKKEEKTNRENTKEKEHTQKGQKRKSDAYGGWTEVVEEDSTPVDLQLPESAQNYISQYQPQVEQRQPKEEAEFGTKTITSLGSASSSSGGPVGFKKRKVKGGARSLRQRDGSS